MRGGRSKAGAAKSESPIGRYAAVLAHLVRGEDAEAAGLASTLVGREDFPAAVADTLVPLAPACCRLRAAIRALLADFEARSEFLEDTPVADTVLALQVLADERGLAVDSHRPCCRMRDNLPVEPETRYARSGDVYIAYQVTGDGPFDVVYVPPFVSHVELAWQVPEIAAYHRRLASFSRLIRLDKRGKGMSDRVSGAPTLEARMDDVRAVMDAVGSERAALLGFSEGGPMSILFAATYPERVWALVLVGSYARVLWAPDYPSGGPRGGLPTLHRPGRAGGVPPSIGQVAASLAPSADEEGHVIATLIRHSSSPGAAAPPRG